MREKKERFFFNDFLRIFISLLGILNYISVGARLFVMNKKKKRKKKDDCYIIYIYICAMYCTYYTLYMICKILNK